MRRGQRGSNEEKAKDPTAYSTARGAKKAWHAEIPSTTMQWVGG